jgi:hypothetical protein
VIRSRDQPERQVNPREFFVAGVLDESEIAIYYPLTMTRRFLTLGYLYFLAHAGGLDV